MDISPQLLRLYAVSDRGWLKENEHLKDLLPKLFENGVTLFQLREKHLNREDFLREALEAKEVCRRYRIPLIINDAVDIAKEIGADGVHVGLSDMEITKARPYSRSRHRRHHAGKPAAFKWQRHRRCSSHPCTVCPKRHRRCSKAAAHPGRPAVIRCQRTCFTISTA